MHRGSKFRKQVIGSDDSSDVDKDEVVNRINQQANSNRMEAQIQQIIASLTRLENVVQQQNLGINELRTRIHNLERVNNGDERIRRTPTAIPMELESAKHPGGRLPVFDGDREKYASWRMQVMLVNETYANNPGKHYEFLQTLMTDKIAGIALQDLSSDRTEFNFNSIIDRLDITFGDNRPIDLLIEEMQIMSQEDKEPLEFYKDVEKHLSVLKNKIGIEEANRPDAQKSLVERANKQALSVLKYGLRRYYSRELQLRAPKSFGDAYSKLQAIVFEVRKRRVQAQKRNSEAYTRTNAVPYNNSTPVRRNYVPGPEYQKAQQQQQVNNNPNQIRYRDTEKKIEDVSMRTAPFAQKRDVTMRTAAQNTHRTQKMNNIGSDNEGEAIENASIWYDETGNGQVNNFGGKEEDGCSFLD